MPAHVQQLYGRFVLLLVTYFASAVEWRGSGLWSVGSNVLLEVA